jgi:hypothetical protein
LSAVDTCFSVEVLTLLGSVMIPEPIEVLEKTADAKGCIVDHRCDDDAVFAALGVAVVVACEGCGLAEG